MFRVLVGVVGFAVIVTVGLWLLISVLTYVLIPILGMLVGVVTA